MATDVYRVVDASMEFGCASLIVDACFAGLGQRVSLRTAKTYHRSVQPKSGLQERGEGGSSCNYTLLGTNYLLMRLHLTVMDVEDTTGYLMNRGTGVENFTVFEKGSN